jgi:hypothetical protein
VLRGIVLLLTGLVALAGGAAQTPHRPFAIQASEEALGAPVRGLTGTIGLRFLPNKDLAIGLVVHDTSRRAIVVTDARTVGPAGTLVRQIGTELHPYDPPRCPPGAFCPDYGVPLHLGPGRPAALRVGGHHAIGVELDFRLASCAALPTSARAAPSRIALSFHLPGGPMERQVVSLGVSRLAFESRPRCRIR